MDLDNINDIEVLREIAKRVRVKVKEDIDAYENEYTFKKGFWYIVDQDEYYVRIYSEDYTHEANLDYEEASKYLYNKYIKQDF